MEVRNSIQPNTQRHNAIRRDSELTVFVHSSLVESRCPCRDVGEAILVGSLRPIRTAHKTLGGRTLERPSCGGFMPTAETTLFPAYSARSRRLLTSSVRLDNEPILVRTPVLSILEEVGVRSFVHYFSGSSKAAGASFYFR